MFRKLRLLPFLLLTTYYSAQAQVPVATYTATPSSGCAPLGISFNGSTTAGTGPFTWSWTINGGSPSTSVSQNTASIFNTPGTYNVTLVVKNASGSSAPFTTQITVNPPPNADFTQDKTTGCYPTYINFTNTSTPGTGATITSYAWSFGDGTQDSVPNPSHRYTLAGSFPVTLYVTNSFGCTGSAQIKNVQKAITISGGITMNFTSSLNSSCTLPVTASFTNPSTGPPVISYLWDFGDGSPITNNLQNPTHPYTTAGLYNVKLAVTSSQGCSDTLVQKVNITASGNLTDFTYPDSVCVGTLVNFKNISSPFPNSATWNYGDGSPLDNTINGQHTYVAAGTYPVNLNNTFSGCTGAITKNIYVVNPPSTSFTGTNLVSCKPPLTTTFTNTTTGATSWLWSFGDGTSSNLQNPLPHIYTSYGTYSDTLIASSAGGCSTTFIKPNYVIVQKPIVVINGLPGNGCAPYIWTPSVATNTPDGVATYSWIFGNGNTSTLQNPPAQTYGPGVYEVYCTITTNGGCTATDSGMVQVGTVKPVPAFSFIPPTACVKSAVQFKDLSTPAGAVNQWLWQFGDGSTDTKENPSYSYTKPGTYNVRLTAYDNGCWDSISQTIVINPPLADFNYLNTCGASNTFTFLDNSTQALTWLWDFGDNSPKATAQNTSHTYLAGPPKLETVKLVVTNGTCTDSISKNITVNQTTTLIFSTNTVCVNTPLTIRVSALSNIVSFQFEMGDGTITPISTQSVISYSYSKPGIYQVKVITTDVSGCVDSSVAYPLNVSGPTVNFSGPPAVSCGALTVNFKDLTVASPGTFLKTWAWDFGDGGTSPLQNPSHLYNIQGNFVPRLTVTDNNGCSSSLDTAQPIAISIMTPSFNTTDTNSCPNAPVKFNNTSTGGFNPTYSWNFGDGSPLDNTFSPIHNYLNVGTFPDTLTMTDSYGCVKKFGFTSILIDTPYASFTMSGNYSACPVFNDRFTFTGHYAATYAWDFTDGGISQKQNPVNGYALPGDYYPYLIVTSPGGCISKSDSQHVHIDGPVGTFSYNPPYAACDSLTVNFLVTTTNVVSFTWNPGDGSTPVITVTPSFTYTYNKPGGLYTPIVTITDAGGCKLTKLGQNLIQIDTIAKANFYSDKTIVCDSGNIVFTDTSTLGPNTAVTNYVWDFGDGSSPINGLNPTIAHDYTTIGTYTVSMSITTAGGCTGFYSSPITVAASPKISITGILNQCEPAVLTFTGNELVPDPYGPLVWSWNFDNGQTANVQNPNPVSYPKAGEYVVSLTATNTEGCSTMTDTTAPNHLFIYPIPAVNAGADTTICLGTPLQLNASGAATTYNWLPPADPGASLSCLACVNPVANPVPNNTYFVVTGTSLFGCKANDTIQVTVNIPPIVNVSGPDSVCLGQSVQLTATGAALYNWSPTEGLNNANIGNPVATPDASQIGGVPSNVITYIVTGYDSKKCFSDVDSIHVTAFNYPVITLVPNATINVGSSYQISSSATTNIVSLNWTPSNTLSCSDCLTPLATPTKTTKYDLTAVNDGGCSTTDSIRVQVICNGANFFVPNTFSPNGDGINDRFIVNGVGLNVIPSITIYNRWGQIVFQKSNFAPNTPADAWDGTFNGQPAPSDVYIYTIQILCNNATLIPYHGNVTLIR